MREATLPAQARGKGRYITGGNAPEAGTRVWLARAEGLRAVIDRDDVEIEVGIEREVAPGIWVSSGSCTYRGWERVAGDTGMPTYAGLRLDGWGNVRGFIKINGVTVDLELGVTCLGLTLLELPLHLGAWLSMVDRTLEAAPGGN